MGMRTLKVLTKVFFVKCQLHDVKFVEVPEKSDTCMIFFIIRMFELADANSKGSIV